MEPKKTKKADLRNYSFIFLLVGLNAALWSFYIAFAHQTITLNYASVMSGTASHEAPVLQAADESEERILVIKPEDIENIVNTEAFTHAVWPGYRGSVSDGPAVRKHFADNLAKTIINAGGVEVNGTYRVHFYYIVRDDGGIQFLSLVGGGKTTEGTPKYIIRRAQDLVNIGVPGIKPGTDANGEPITVVYEILIKFTPGQ